MTTLITDEYRQLNRDLHRERDDYGNNSGRWAGAVKLWAEQLGCESILDYGCGKGRLVEAMAEMDAPVLPAGYDPAMPPFDIEPHPADMVVCTDVLEHIEPELLDNVLEHIRSLANKWVFFDAATRPAIKTLGDGRNAHLIQEPAAWWMEKLSGYFDLDTIVTTGGDALVLAVPKGPSQ